MSWTLTADAVRDLARGAAVLGTGGGGDPHVGALLAEQAIVAHGPVEVVPLNELPDDAMVVMVAMMGAPTVMVEKLPSLEEVRAAVQAAESALPEGTITHIVCAEIGGVNSTLPVAAAATLGLPLVDADGMGRAFPELQMVLPTLSGIAASPVSFADEKGNVGVVHTADNTWAERIVRVACVEMGCTIMITTFPQRGAQARTSLVKDSVTRAVQVGRAITDSRASNQDPVASVVEVLGGRELFAGKVVDVQRATTAGFARGRARIDGEHDVLELSFQNEHLVAQAGDTVLATTPDLIMVLEHDSGEPITTEGLRYGQRVRVIAAPSDPRWHSAEALQMVGPAYFGYAVEGHRFDGSPDHPEQEDVA
ncbi:DUF917 domain-containing protein [Ornithinimicrobium faecis]|uniref:DUF917 domain-containing protein n=1 Tax=Ornithinimicrobium faecis TaxID=2934158 RepID=A0ABY4YSK2_9MICO|nr:DUF917 domain-containing protein [Ornithinimicrobium sp. HY1793]USQ79152.1 DUF917 domain-containing protein [Ornithinimicrobium sp. HY1793]